MSKFADEKVEELRKLALKNGMNTEQLYDVIELFRKTIAEAKKRGEEKKPISRVNQVRCSKFDICDWYGKDAFSTLSNSQIDELGYNFDFIVYSYYGAGYEGNGNAIVKKEGKYYHFSLSHCSCYGPLSSPSFNDGKNTLKEIVESFSDDLRMECKEIINKIKQLEANND